MERTHPLHFPKWKDSIEISSEPLQSSSSFSSAKQTSQNHILQPPTSVCQQSFSILHELASHSVLLCRIKVMRVLNSAPLITVLPPLLLCYAHIVGRQEALSLDASLCVWRSRCGTAVLLPSPGWHCAFLQFRFWWRFRFLRLRRLVGGGISGSFVCRGRGTGSLEIGVNRYHSV